MDDDTQVSADEFERQYAERSRLTVEALRGLGRVVRPCHCGEDGCQGWQSVNVDDYRVDLTEFMRATPDDVDAALERALNSTAPGLPAVTLRAPDDSE